MDGGTQSRAQLDWMAIDEYAAAMKDGDEFPPVIVYYDGSAYWLADGFHRVRAAEKAGLAKIAADIRQGTRRDAVLHSVGANALHGVRRTNRDKRLAITVLLNDPEWAKNTDNEIARLTGTSFYLASTTRKSISNFEIDDGIRIRRDRWGNEATYDSRAISRTKNAKFVSLFDAPAIDAEYGLMAPDSEIEISFHDMEFAYRIAPHDRCLIERCPNRDVNGDGARWYWYLRRDTDLETYDAFLVLSNSMGLPIKDEMVSTANEELVYEGYDIEEYDIEEYDADDYDVDDYDADEMSD
jgi:hypothetical protein